MQPFYSYIKSLAAITVTVLLSAGLATGKALPGSSGPVPAIAPGSPAAYLLRPQTTLIYKVATNLDTYPLTVSTPASSQDSTLRAAITFANAQASGVETKIIFKSNYKIRLNAALPAITRKVTIDGESQGRVTIDGNGKTGLNFSTLELTGTYTDQNKGAKGSEISFLKLQNFSGSAVLISVNSCTVRNCIIVKGTGGNSVEVGSIQAQPLSTASPGTLLSNIAIKDNRIGIDSSGTGIAMGSTMSGIIMRYVSNNSDTAHYLQRNYIANAKAGVYLTGCNAIRVSKNTIGTNAAGTSIQNFSNTDDGIKLLSNSTAMCKNIIVTDNLLSGNRYGVKADFTYGLTLERNYIGVNRAGTGALENSASGVFVAACDLAADSNVVSGNKAEAFNINAAYAFNNNSFTFGGVTYDALHGTYEITNNRIGTDKAGSAPTINPFANTLSGIKIIGSSNRVCLIRVKYNVISGNGGAGVFLNALKFDPLSTVNDNIIGTDLAGTQVMGNSSYGIYAATIGNDSATYGSLHIERNLVSGNERGINITNTRCFIKSNTVGTNKAGTAGIGNTSYNLYLKGSHHTRVRHNLISGSIGTSGILAELSDHLVIEYNKVGINRAGSAAIPNKATGMSLSGGHHALVRNNIVSGNEGTGIYITNTNGVDLTNNTIGLDTTRTFAVGNGNRGLYISKTPDSPYNKPLIKIAGNVISGNAASGVLLNLLKFQTSSFVRNNRIGTDGSGTAAVPNNGNGLQIADCSVFGTDSLLIEDNTFSGNVGQGVHLLRASTLTFRNNKIGTNSAGTAAIGNQNGMLITTSDSLYLDNNCISGNSVYGVNLDGTLLTNPALVHFENNKIGSNQTVTYAIPNVRSGIYSSGISGLTLTNNFLSGNKEYGAHLTAYDSLKITDNRVGTKADGLNRLANKLGGIYLNNPANKVTKLVALRNTLSGNKGPGMLLANMHFLPGSRLMANKFGMEGDTSNSGIGLSILTCTGGLRVGSDSSLYQNFFMQNGLEGLVVNGTSGVQISGNVFYRNGYPLTTATTKAIKLTNGNAGKAAPNDFLLEKRLTAPNTYEYWAYLPGSVANQNDTVEFFSGSLPGTAWTGPLPLQQARKYLGRGIVGTTRTAVKLKDPAYSYISATATNTGGNTSELGGTIDKDQCGSFANLNQLNDNYCINTEVSLRGGPAQAGSTYTYEWYINNVKCRVSTTSASLDTVFSVGGQKVIQLYVIKGRCLSVATDTIQVIQPAVATLNTSGSRPVSCKGAQDGWASFSFSPATVEYRLYRNGVPGPKVSITSGTLAFTDLPMGHHALVYGASSSNCTDSLLFDIGVAPPEITQFSSSFVPCAPGLVDGQVCVTFNYLSPPADLEGFTLSIRDLKGKLIEEQIISGLSIPDDQDPITGLKATVLFDSITAGHSYILELNAYLQDSESEVSRCPGCPGEYYCTSGPVTVTFNTPPVKLTLPGAQAIDHTSRFYVCDNDSARITVDLSATVDSCSREFEGYKVVLYKGQLPLDSSTYAAVDSLVVSASTFEINDSITFMRADTGRYTVVATAGTAAGSYGCRATKTFEVVDMLDRVELTVAALPTGCNLFEATASLTGVNASYYRWVKDPFTATPDTITRQGQKLEGMVADSLEPGHYLVLAYLQGMPCAKQDTFTLAPMPALPELLIVDYDSVKMEYLCEVYTRVISTQAGRFPLTWYRQDTIHSAKFIKYHYEEMVLNGTASAPDTVLSVLPAELLNDTTYAFYVKIESENGCLDSTATDSLTRPRKERDFKLCLQWGNLPADTLKTEPVNSNLMAALTGKDIKAEIQDRLSACMEQQAEIAAKLFADACISGEALNDTLHVDYPQRSVQFTLYYHDRAGNLVRTVPPEGVKIKADRTPVTPLNAHTHVTGYAYNSLGQLLSQTTPDAGTSRFVYNPAGQLRLSQNAVQAGTGAYSYTKYDAIGRVNEVGRSSYVQATDSGLFKANPTYSTWNSRLAYDTSSTAHADTLFPQLAGHTLTEKTVTVYSDSMPGLSYFGRQGQRYLQNRVSYAYRINNATDTVFTAYSYDPHGNVSWLAQDVPGLGINYLAYDYDLRSGKVLGVRYNEFYKDRFFHRYSYDEDGRLTLAETSANGYYYDRDARYEYYAHGPLQRLELGHDKVQGLDYAYTLQGWLKGINSPVGDTLRDIGGDGRSSSAFSADAFAMGLNYYDGDYQAVNSVFNAAGVAGSKMPAANHDLYNGNISAWVGKLQGETVPSGSQYRYDQLNRLREAKRTELTNGQWTGPITSHKLESNYEYDANGNLLKLNRYDQNGNLMDNLTYSYADGNNRLDTVTDVVSTAYLKDLEGTNTYLYDANGNIRRDVKEGIDITWDTYGKVKKIEPVSGTTRPIIRFLYDAQGNRVQKLTDRVGTDTATFYVRDAQGNTMAAYKGERATTTWSLKQNEISLYGSDRLGTYNPDFDIPSARYIDTASVRDTLHRFVDRKSYELKDHLGNVRAVVSDQKASSVSVAANGSGPDSTLTLNLTAKLLSSNNYYPFGMEEPGSGSSIKGYRYGFNGKEKDQKGEWGLTSYDYGFRIYNPALAKFLSVDPLTQDYPELSTYQFASNNPIQNIDVDGLEGADFKFDMFQRQKDAKFSKVSYRDIQKKENEKVGQALHISSQFMPILGDINDLNDAVTDARSGNYQMAALSAFSLVPGSDFVVKPLKFAIKHGDEAADLFKIGSKAVQNVDDLYRTASKLPVGERVAVFKDAAAKFAKENKWEVNKDLMKKNKGRTIFTDEAGKHFSLDTQHGTFEVLNKKGKHMGEIDLSGKVRKPADTSGKHDIEVK